MDPVSGQCNCDSGFVNKISNEKKVKNISIMVNLRIFSSKIQTVRILEEISQHVLGVKNWPEKIAKRNSKFKSRISTQKIGNFEKNYFVIKISIFRLWAKAFGKKNFRNSLFFDLLGIRSEINQYLG